MKYFFILFLSSIFMSNMCFEKFLGEDINSVSFMGYSKNELDKNIYTIERPKIMFLENKIDKILISTTDNKRINQFYLVLSNKLGITDYKKIEVKYGSSYLVKSFRKNIDSISSHSTRVDKSFFETIKQESRELVEGDIYDPRINSIIWNCNSFRIMLFNNYDKSRTEVYFMKK